MSDDADNRTADQPPPEADNRSRVRSFLEAVATCFELVAWFFVAIVRVVASVGAAIVGSCS